MEKSEEKAVASTRRRGTESAASRTQLLDAADQLMRNEGYAAVTSRRLAAEAGLKPQLVHYYFKTMDDVFVACFNRMAEKYLGLQKAAVSAPNPLKALWDISFDQAHAALAVEFMARANHQKELKLVIAAFGEEARRVQSQIITRVLKESQIDTKEWPPVVLAFILECTARSLTLESNLGQSGGHRSVIAFVKRMTDRLS
jgi:AcrR family transcriptional regulator